MTQNSFAMFCQNLARLVGTASAGKLSDFECLMAARMFAGLIFSPTAWALRELLMGLNKRRPLENS